MPDKEDLSIAKVLDSEPLESKDARWLRLRSLTYRNPAGQTKKWESAERTTRADSTGIDSVGAVAILQKDDGPEIVLQRQFRPPIGKICIEIPSGLIDEGESAEQAAIRELKEETGYVGEVIKHPGDESADARGPLGVMYADPGMSNTNTILIHMKIDMSREENINPKPDLEENEFIETFTIKLDKFLAEIRKMEAEGYAIDARVATMAEGFEIRRKFFS